MRIAISNHKYFISAGLFTSLMFFWPSVSAQTPAGLDQIRQIVLDGLEKGKETQLKIDEIDNERTKLANDYRETLKHNAKLKIYNDSLRQDIQSQKDTVESLKQQIDRVSNLDRDIVPLMSEMLDTLENFIALDIPFLKKEREKRIKALRDLLRNGKISNAEKYRRILEAYQIENDYGRTIEAYTDILIEENGTEKTVSFLKVGRVAFFYQTLDMSETYTWLHKDRKWRRLERRYNSDIYEGIRMAKELIPSNLMFIPIYALPLSSTS